MCLLTRRRINVSHTASFSYDHGELTQINVELAFAASKIEPRPTPGNPNFCFTKTLTKNFFGAGIIELPPRGYKGTKNSRRFQFLFFVHYGKVAVEVAGNRFVISKGGMWQVPRGKSAY